MMVGRLVWAGRFVQLAALPILLLAAACAPPAGSRAVHRDTLSGRFVPVPGSDVDGRLYALGQMLAHEQERTAALQQQLEERISEVDRLHNDVEQLQARQTELEAALQNGAAAPGHGAAVVGAVTDRGVGGRRDAEPAPQVQQAAVRDVPDDRLIAARAEADAAQAQATQAQNALASMRAELAEEQQRREATEAELARLKQETSAPPYGQPAGSEAEAAAAKQEVIDLRAALDSERAARERLAQQFEALQQQAQTQQAAASADDAANAAQGNTELETELKRLRQEKQAVADSFARSLAESQKRAADLEQQLALARAAAAAPSASAAAPPDAGEISSMRAENATLRTRLDEEHRRTEELAAKLKIATRVTDLIFKMQAQQAQPQPHSR